MADERQESGVLVPWVRAVRADEVESLAREMAADQHSGAQRITHLAIKGGQIAGAFSVGNVALVMAWAHTQRAKARDSLVALNVVENLVAAAYPGREICVPVEESSPFAPVMGKLGYRDLGQARLWVKRV